MSRRRIGVGMVALALATGGAATAQAGEWRLGVKASRVDSRIAGADDPTNLALVLGREWGIGVGDLALELEVSRTTDSGRVGGADLDVDSEAAYLAFRSAGPVYLVARLGAAHAERTGRADVDDSAAGVGLGVSAGLFRLELEYTDVGDGDVRFLSFGVWF
ncbi:hypothetical protein [Inmirania thermothiophila]|uniref:Outer membrane protein with beta-barrel domain n=1 Tax=Inmirania thermothiophila TaxID=1750597 RepID=A0A3N1XZN0_9GAMM|nr:hypothetical protein [Inmirania thermothiophila]ROR32064.1 hypothetical protein EDC57_1252 [Inmirania thermothiophila]